MKNIVLVNRIVIFLIVVFLIVVGIQLTKKSSAQKLSEAMERFQHNTKIRFPADVQVLEGEDLTGRDISVKLLLFIPKGTFMKFLECLGAKKTDLKEVKTERALFLISSDNSMNFKTKLNAIEHWENIEIHKYGGTLSVFLAFQENGDSFAFIRFIT